ncbi:MAG: hypothetical protein ONB30_00175 [candidate division KSB1 bacterium]|nr:hypothetical protein [candidate division KSB1 bacterium]
MVGGDWDLNTAPFEDLDVYRSLEARYVYGVPWEETSYFGRLTAQLDSGKNPCGVHTSHDIEEHLAGIDRLFNDVRQGGYRTQGDLQGQSRSLCSLDEITVRIGRSGDFLFEDGRHRLAIAKILRLPRIPVMVTWRHKEWYQFRLQILHYARRHGGKLYQPVTHPDLSDIPAAHGDERFRLIKSNMPLKGGTLLGIGANWGYFCHRFEEEGFRCYAVEKGSEDFYFLNRLRLAEGRKFAAVHADLFDFWEMSDFDVVLALNVFHHFLKAEDTYQKLIQWLRRINARVYFFEPHLPDEPQMKGAFVNFTPEEFARFVAQHARLSHWECIGYGEERRPIYRLTRE